MADRKMSIVEHLDELRARLIIVLAAVGVGAGVAFWKVREIVSWLVLPPAGKLVFFSPTEAFVSYCKVAVFAGLVIASPVVFYQLWRFASSALEPRERSLILVAVPFSVALFLSGAAFAFFVVIPWALKFLLEFAGPDLVPMLSVSKYLSFVIMLVLVFGVVFELPVAVVILAKLGVVTPRSLARNRGYAILAIFIAAAVLTPSPDAFTQVLLAAPLYLLYEVSIVLSRLVRR